MVYFCEKKQDVQMAKLWYGASAANLWKTLLPYFLYCMQIYYTEEILLTTIWYNCSEMSHAPRKQKYDHIGMHGVERAWHDTTWKRERARDANSVEVFSFLSLSFDVWSFTSCWMLMWYLPPLCCTPGSFLLYITLFFPWHYTLCYFSSWLFTWIIRKD